MFVCRVLISSMMVCVVTISSPGIGRTANKRDGPKSIRGPCVL